MTDIVARCEAKGLRMTDQRRTVAQAIDASGDHPDVEALHARAAAIDPRISVATVYRTVKLFEEAGILMPNAISFSVQDEISTGEMAFRTFERFGPPYVVKATSEGTSHGIRIANDLVELPDIIGDILDAYGTALVEEWLKLLGTTTFNALLK